MKIGVISDTHIPGKAAALPDIVLKAFQGVDHIIHAGDVTVMGVIAELEKLAPVTAVAGNLDPPELRERFGEKALLKLGDFTFGVCHGHGEKKSTVDRAIARFTDDPVRCIVFGHSHIPCSRYHGDILLFNPGSPTDKRRSAWYSFGIIDADSALKPRIVYFDGFGRVIREIEGCIAAL